MFERFAEPARRVMVLAQEQARLLNHNYIGTEHILLGLCAQGEGTAARALSSLGISLADVRRGVEEIVGVGGGEFVSGHIPFTPRAKKVMELSLREALQLGHNYIGTEHILLGLVREGEGVAAQVLTQLGAHLDQVRQAVIQRLSGYPGAAAGEMPHPEQVTRSPQQPACPRCLAPLAGNLRHDLVEVGDDEPPVLALWCGACGATLAFKPPPGATG